MLVYRSHANDYVYTTVYTAEMWIRHKIGTLVNNEFLETKDPIDIKKLQQDIIFEKVNNLNSKIISMQKHHDGKLSDTKIKYDSLFVNMDEKKTKEEKRIIEKFHNTDSMSKKVLSQQISDIREKYAQVQEDIVDEKSRILEILENQHQTNIINFVKNYESDSEIIITWNSQNPVFEVGISLS